MRLAGQIIENPAGVLGLGEPLGYLSELHITMVFQTIYQFSY